MDFMVGLAKEFKELRSFSFVIALRSRKNRGLLLMLFKNTN
ncbi:hypothetical protein HMPREF1420_00101 [Helicobacter pylori GAM264Ai]|nr:hypothetical protein HMPREF1420_00101 [Helicobacter pylori GAM264Ai]